jgi:hypothetical protein
MNKSLLLAAAVLLSGCAARRPVPYKRPMQESYQQALKDLPVYTHTPENGIGVGYRGRDSRVKAANLAANLTKGFDPAGTERQLQEALASNLRGVPWRSPQAQVKHMSSEQRLDAAKFSEPAVMTVELDCVMSPDLAHLYLIADVRIHSKNLRYAGVYPNEAESWANAEKEYQQALRKAKRDGTRKPEEIPDLMLEQLYRNTFKFISSEVLVTDTSEAKIAAIRARYTDAAGRAPAERDKRAKMNYEISTTQSAELQQLLEQRAKFWLANDSAELKRAIEEGAQALAQLIARDLQDTQVPVLKGRSDDQVELVAKGPRRIVRIGRGHLAGQYVSEPDSSRRLQRWNAVARGDATATQQ